MSPRTAFTALLKPISILVVTVSMAWAVPNPTEAAARQLLDAAVANVVSIGGEAAAKDFVTSRKWHDGTTYIVMNDFHGTVLAHSANAKMVGKVMLNVRDAAGKLFVQEGLHNIKTKGESVVDLQWGNPVTKKIAAAQMISKRVPGQELYINVLIFK